MIRIILLLIAICAALPSQADDTTRARLKRKATIQATALTAPRPDTIPALGGELTIAGYDKPLNARRATFHVTSQIADTITGFTVNLDYRDASGRQLHNETVTVDCTIPPYETRLAEIPAWDTQGRYFYSRGKQPRARGVTPFDVTCRVISIIMLCRK